MIGIIVTGHGRFAQGLKSAIEVIAGEQRKFIAVNFEKEVKELEQDLTKALNELQDCEGVLVFTDLQGGSPFKTIVELSMNRSDIEILAGVNMPMLAEVVLARNVGMDLDTLAATAIQTGKEMMTRFDFSVLFEEEEEIIEEDGI